MKKLSFVVPIYNEKEGIVHFLDSELMPVIARIENGEYDKIARYSTELIIVNDGSTDGTAEILKSYVARHQDIAAEIRVVSFSRNFGKEIALAAGLREADGDAVITIDGDGQQPPAKIPAFIDAWENGAQIITGVRNHYTKHGLIPRLGSRLFYWLLGKMGNRTTVPGSTDFRLLDREVVDEYNKLTEHNRITRGLIDWLGFKQQNLYYDYGARYAGKPSYNFSKLFHLAMDSFVSMSDTPLTIFAWIGALITLFGFILGVFCIINQYILDDPLHLYWNGAVQMSIFITFLIGLLMISQSATALYISHIHAESQNRPLYIIDRRTSINLKRSDKKNNRSENKN